MKQYIYIVKKYTEERKSDMKAVRIRTEYLKDPIGIDIRNPRIFWNCDGGKKQTAFQVVSGSFDSGKIESDSMTYECSSETGPPPSGVRNPNIPSGSVLN